MKRSAIPERLEPQRSAKPGAGDFGRVVSLDQWGGQRLNRHREVVRVFDHDPDLLCWVDDEEKVAAVRRNVTVAVEELPRGEWRAEHLFRGPVPPMAVLVLEGFLVRSVEIGQWRGLELIGPGDVLHAREHWDSFAPIEYGAKWEVLESGRVALLDHEFERAAAVLPGVLSELFGRAVLRTESLALHRALSHLPALEDRLLHILWHVAERWGRTTASGILLPLRLSHDLLADVVTARRPSVSGALKKLVASGQIVQLDRRWVLTGEPPAEVERLARSDGVTQGALGEALGGLP